MSGKNKTKVVIGGKIYTLSGYESEEYLQRVAAYIDNKVSELEGLDGYRRMPSEMKSILLNLNTADDYFKMKNVLEDREREIAEKEKELYEVKHELILAQVRLEGMEKSTASLQDEKNDAEKRIIQLETQLNQLNGGNASKQ